MNKTKAGIIAAAGVLGIIATSAFLPESNQSRSLGKPGQMWNGVYTPFISDGDNVIPVSNIALKSDNIVYFTDEGNIHLPNAHKLLGSSPGGQDFNLIELNQWGQVDVGSEALPVNLNSSIRPTIQVGDETGPQAESMAFVSDLDAYTDTVRLDALLSEKADLVGGKVSVDQLPIEVISQTWSVPTASDLVTLTDAKQNDYARITSGADAGDTYVLVDTDPTKRENWINMSGEGSVIAVNGKTGAVTLDLSDFSGVQTEFSKYLPLTGGTLSSNLRIDNSAQLYFVPPTVGTKINLFGLAYSIGIEPAAVVYNTPPTGKHVWKAGSTNIGYIDATDLYVGGVPVRSTLNAKASLASPALTGIPSAPTAAPETNNTQIANTKFVKDQDYATTAALTSGLAGKANATHIHTTDQITGLDSALMDKAPLASPVFTGIPRGTTAEVGDNTTRFATTAFVAAALSASEPALQFMVVEDQKSNGIGGGTMSAGAWYTRDLNTVISNTITGASLSSNRITLPSGTYYVQAKSAFFSHQNWGISSVIRIFNVTTGAQLGRSINNVFGFPAGASGGVPQSLDCIFTLKDTSAIELQYGNANTGALNPALGVAQGIPDIPEVYSQVVIMKID